MPRHKLFWRLFRSYLLVTLLSLLAVGWYATNSLRHSYLSEKHADLMARAHLIAGHVGPLVVAENFEAVQAFCHKAGPESGTRITVILHDGVVMGDSDEDPAAMESHADRPEIREAFQGKVGTISRYSNTLSTSMMYVAIPVKSGGEVVAVIRTSLPLMTLHETLRAHTNKILLGALVIAALAIVSGLMISRWISRPLEEMRRGAERFAQGEFDLRIPVLGSEELRALSGALNNMARQLDNRIQTIARQRNEREAILSSMVEGVLALDKDMRIISINQAAGKILGVDPSKTAGRNMEEVVRHPELQALLRNSYAQPSLVESEIILHNGGDRFIRVLCSGLAKTEENHVGAVAVLSDMTHIRKLENMRRDFVANVSHELKTPITAIKGFVETLLDEAEPPNAETTRHFLTIVARQGDRLNAIIEDLLLLSRIEQDGSSQELAREAIRLPKALSAAIEVCARRAKDKDIRIQVDCPDDLRLSANRALLEQAIANLVDNAIKYSDDCGTVTVTGAVEGKDVVIRVQDHGCGIEPEHHDRLFERFYRVDKARSRQLGGTGLGLAIVKHIVQAHHGRVEVESTPGQGSTFTLRIPLG